MKSLKWLWQYISPYKRRLFLALGLTLTNAILSNIRPYITGLIVDGVFRGGNFDILIPLVLAFIATIVFKDIFRICDHYMLEDTSQIVIMNIRRDLYSSMQQQDFTYFDKNRTGDIMTKMSADVEGIRHFVAWVINSAFESAVLFISALLIMGYINWKLTLCLFLVTPVIGIIAFRQTKSVHPVFHNIRQSLSRLNTVVQENISGNRVVKAFTRESYEIEKFKAANLEYKNANIEGSKVWRKYVPLLDSMANSLNVIILIAGGILTIRGDMTVGELVTFNSLSWALNTPMRNVGWLINDSLRTITSLEKVKEMVEERPKIYTKEEYITKDRIKGKVEFRNVSFSYGDTLVLDNISFTANCGESVAIIGATGSGKSTLISLISRFYDVTEGEILIDDINIKEYNLKKLRQNISMAMQDVFLFSDTIEGNISYGVPDASFNDVEEVAKAADAHDFIVEMTEGYDTIVGERGVGLSGGQKQRIALARALLSDSPILILDDTTSSVDVETEHYIQQTLKQYAKNKTTFIIAHRISSVKDCDQILVLDKGRIVERGTHEELLAKGGYYKKIYDIQQGNLDKVTA
ncbi:MAG: ABC transporter ATP-binding protein [Clostridiaceae bacterium]|nr:ABC transporter ATP-binding protein [Clostridiaceae bacterium]